MFYVKLLSFFLKIAFFFAVHRIFNWVMNCFSIKILTSFVSLKFTSTIPMKNNLLLLFTLTFFANSFGQTPLWRKTSEEETRSSIKMERSSIPAKYELFSLNLTALQSQLLQAPLDSENRLSQLILPFPNPKGELENYRIYEAPVMETGLSAKYPTLKTYSGRSITNPAETIRFSVTLFGLHVMSLSGENGTFYIDTYTKDLANYIVYKKQDITASSFFHCSVTDESQEIINDFENSNQNRASDSFFRTYRLAMACTIEYAAFHVNAAGLAGGTTAQKKAAVLSAMVVTMARVNGVFEKDMSLRMNLVATNDLVIFIDSDSFDNANSGTLINQSQTVINANIGAANYDIGHTVSTGGGGLAQLFSPCTTNKARGITGQGSPVGDPFDIDYVAHEMGHQWGANHTQNNACNRNAGTAVEPGSASTIMGYAGICAPNVQSNSDAYFHTVSISEMIAFVSGTGGTCAVATPNGNAAPTANAGLDFTIPRGTAFVLKGTSTDADGDTLTYCWEQTNNQTSTQPPTQTATTGPNFRSLTPSSSPDRYMPPLASVVAGNLAPTWEVVPNVARTMNFAFTVRDNATPTGGQTQRDNMVLTVASVGPFLVTSQNAPISYVGNSTQTITWDVAGTTANGINCANVDILLSTNGGVSFTNVLVSATPNDGTQSVTIPNLIGSNNRIMIRGTNHLFYDVSNANFAITSGVSDTIPPTAPTLTASGTTAFTTNLSWSGATDNIGVTEYDVYQNGVLIGTTSLTTFPVTGLAQSTTYAFTVRAKDGSGNVSVPSNVVNVTTLISYCTSQGNSVVDELIGNVQLGSINNTSTGGTGYTDFTAISTDLALGSTNTITITPFWTGTIYPEAYAVFIDYNRDGDFIDAGETVFTQAATTATPISGSFTVPSTLTLGTTRMRVSMKYNGLPTSCETFDFGQVEDYTINLVSSTAIVNLNLFIEGYFDYAAVGGNIMNPVLANQTGSGFFANVEEIQVELHHPTTLALVSSVTGTLYTDGNIQVGFPATTPGQYYIVVKGNNFIETWSATPQTLGAVPLSYDFTSAASQAFGNNMKEVRPGVWAFYSGDINQDGNVDNSDYTLWETDSNNFAFGPFATDLNGDGNVDNSDYTFWETNANGFVFAITP